MGPVYIYLGPSYGSILLWHALECLRCRAAKPRCLTAKPLCPPICQEILPPSAGETAGICSRRRRRRRHSSHPQDAPPFFFSSFYVHTPPFFFSSYLPRSSPSSSFSGFFTFLFVPSHLCAFLCLVPQPLEFFALLRSFQLGNRLAPFPASQNIYKSFKSKKRKRESQGPHPISMADNQYHNPPPPSPPPLHHHNPPLQQIAPDMLPGRHNQQPYDPPLDPRHRSPSPMGGGAGGAGGDYEMNNGPRYHPQRQNTAQMPAWPDNASNTLIAQPTVSPCPPPPQRFGELTERYPSTRSPISPTATTKRPRCHPREMPCARPSTPIPTRTSFTPKTSATTTPQPTPTSRTRRPPPPAPPILIDLSTAPTDMAALTTTTAGPCWTPATPPRRRRRPWATLAPRSRTSRPACLPSRTPPPPPPRPRPRHSPAACGAGRRSSASSCFAATWCSTAPYPRGCCRCCPWTTSASSPTCATRPLPATLPTLSPSASPCASSCFRNHAPPSSSSWSPCTTRTRCCSRAPWPASSRTWPTCARAPAPRPGARMPGRRWSSASSATAAARSTPAPAACSLAWVVTRRESPRPRSTTPMSPPTSTRFLPPSFLCMCTWS